MVAKLEAHRSYCMVFLSKTLYPLLSISSTQKDRKFILIMTGT